MNETIEDIFNHGSFVDNIIKSIEDQVETDPLDYENCKKQFTEISEDLGLKHSFTFEEAWETATEIRKRDKLRSQMLDFQGKLLEHECTYSPEELKKHNPLKHSFADGMYIREVINEPGQIIITKIHKQCHPFFLMYGDMSILTDSDVIKLTGPHYGVTEPGTKRIIYTHTKCKFVTVHLTEKTDLDGIEDEVIAKDFSDPKLRAQDIEVLKRYLK